MATPPVANGESELELTENGRALRDASGVAVPLRRYERIASGSLVSDAILVELCEPDRIVSFTTYSGHHAHRPHRFSGKPHVDALRDVEGLLAIKPDLLITSTHANFPMVGRLREHDVEVYNLGEMGGLESFENDVEVIARLIGHPERGERYLREFRRRIDRIAAHVSHEERKTAVYVSVYGNKLFGGARNTSFHDLLDKAGLEDVAARHYAGWPQYGPEDLLRLDPEVIVTNTGMSSIICSQPGLARLKACARGEQGMVEGPPVLLGDPGAGLLPAAELVHEKAYGDSP
jgi:iron complex transport system substrate-binding protein